MPFFGSILNFFLPSESCLARAAFLLQSNKTHRNDDVTFIIFFLFTDIQVGSLKTHKKIADSKFKQSLCASGRYAASPQIR